jgi:hypothetical protein
MRYCMRLLEEASGNFENMSNHIEKIGSRVVHVTKAVYCYMLGFLGNMTSAPCCITMGLLRFLSNTTVPVV